jgi:uncharacterized protein YjbJ (UPF0337 family)
LFSAPHDGTGMTIGRWQPSGFAASAAGKYEKGELVMNWDRIEGNWKQFKGKVQQQWGDLTDDDLDRIEGKRNELAGRLQARYGYAKDKAEQEIDSWLKSTQ